MMKKIKIFVLVVVFSLTFSCNGVFAEEKDSLKENEVIDMQLEEKEITTVDEETTEYEETYGSVIEVPNGINMCSLLEGSKQNVYWKASVKITYTVSDGYAQLTKVSGKWTQLNGNSSISKRYVTYLQNYLSSNNNSGSNNPQGNSFTYSTNFKKGKVISNKSTLAATTTATITCSGGTKKTIEARVTKKL